MITNLEKELQSLGIVCTDDAFDKKFEIKNDSIENLMIISHAGTMSVFTIIFLKPMPHIHGHGKNSYQDTPVIQG